MRVIWLLSVDDPTSTSDAQACCPVTAGQGDSVVVGRGVRLGTGLGVALGAGVAVCVGGSVAGFHAQGKPDAVQPGRLKSAASRAINKTARLRFMFYV